MIFLTSDLHGKFESLIALLEKARFFEDENNQLYILGDVIDRNNNGGIDILKWIIDTPNVELLLGNHEKMLLDSRWIFDDFSDITLHSGMIKNLDRWKHNGADCTIKALKQETLESRRRMLDYLEACSLYKTIRVKDETYVLIHGGLGNYSPNKNLADYSDDELLWERPYLTTVYNPDEFTVILGHTPTSLYDKHYQNQILKTDSWWDIDTGAANKDGQPMLLCLDTLSEYYLDE